MTVAAYGLAIVMFLLVVIWAGQRRLMYFSGAAGAVTSCGWLERRRAGAFAAADGVILHGWFLPGTRSPAPFTVVVFNGNAGNRAYRAGLGAALRSRGLSVLLFDYRGYGENGGAPTESGLAADARAARAYLLGRRDVTPDRLVYFGESLGTAVATKLAANTRRSR